MTAGATLDEWAAALRAGARQGLLRRICAWLGIGSAVRRADAHAARCEHGARGERATARLLAHLEGEGWHIQHNLALPGARSDLDHVLVSPCGTAVVVLDSKAWRRTWTTLLVDGRVHCGLEDRHKQVENVAGYARRVAAALNLPEGAVRPLMVVHGSDVADGYLAAPTPHGPVLVLSPPYLVPTLSSGPKARDLRRAGELAAHVFSVLSSYVQRG